MYSTDQLHNRHFLSAADSKFVLRTAIEDTMAANDVEGSPVTFHGAFEIRRINELIHEGSWRFDPDYPTTPTPVVETPVVETPEHEAEFWEAKYHEMEAKRQQLIDSLCDIAEDPETLDFPRSGKWCSDFNAWMIRNGGVTATEIDDARNRAEDRTDHEVDVTVSMSRTISIRRSLINDYDAVWEELHGLLNRYAIDEVTED